MTKHKFYFDIFSLESHIKLLKTSMLELKNLDSNITWICCYSAIKVCSDIDTATK